MQRIKYLLLASFVSLSALHSFSQQAMPDDVLSDASTRESFLPDALFSAPVYFFIDNYLLHLLSLPSKTEQASLLQQDMVSLRFNEVEFKQSNHSLSSILRLITPTSTFILQENQQDFLSTWIVDNNSIEFRFPKQYDLILGKDKKELTQSFRSDLLAFSCEEEIRTPDLYYDAGKAINDVFPDLGDSYVIPQMKSGRYVQKKGENYDFVLNERMGVESILNLFSDSDLMNRKNKLRITVKGYDTSDSFDYTLNCLTAYMKSHACKAYVGIETETEDKYTGTVFYVNRELMYKHLFYFEFPKSAIKREQEQIVIKAYPYIPINNIGDLYEDVTLELIQ